MISLLKSNTLVIPMSVFKLFGVAQVILVINLFNRGTNAEQGDYIGCFVDNTDHSSFPFKPNKANAILDANKCIDACSAAYYMYAALFDAKSCTCGSSYKNIAAANNESCSKECIANPAQLCGGSTAISVYYTAMLIPGPPQNLTNTKFDENSLTVEWKAPSNINGGITQYKVLAKILETFDHESKADQFEWLIPNNTLRHVAGGLIAGSKYNLSVQAMSQFGDGPSVYGVFWSEVETPPEPPQADILKREGINFTIQLPLVHLTGGPLTMYRVIVIDDSVAPTFEPSKLTNSTAAKTFNIPYYITAELSPQEAVKKPFVVGDGATYRSYYNMPIAEDKPVTVIVGIISSLNNVTKMSYSKPAVYQATLLTEDTNVKGGERSYESQLEHGPGDGYIIKTKEKRVNTTTSGVVIGLSVAIGIGSALLIASFIIYAWMKRYYNRHRQASDHQELTVHQSPALEPVENGIVSSILVSEEADLIDVFKNLKDCYCHIPRSCLEMGTRVIGHGKFGPVRLGMVHRSSQQIPVLIQTTPEQSTLTDRERRNLLGELNSIVKLGVHDNLIAFVGACEEKDLFHLTVEHFQVSLKEFLLESRALDHYPVYAQKQNRFATVRETQLLEFAVGIAQGMNFLVQYKIIHGTLMSKYIKVVDGTIPKVAHFSLAHYDGVKEHCDHSRWSAVETIRNKLLTFKSDVWSFGVVLWEISSLGGTPYASVKSKDVSLRVTRGMRLHQTKYLGDDLYQLMLQCWQIDLDERPLFLELITTLEKMCKDEQNDHLNFDLYPGFEYEKYDAELEIQCLGKAP